MPTYLEGFGISHYRSFGPEVQNIGPFSKINFFVGQNNCGKSNVLSFLQDEYARAVNAISQTIAWKFAAELDLHEGQIEGGKIFSTCFKIPGSRYESLLKAFQPQKDILVSLFNSSLLNQNGAVYFPFVGNPERMELSPEFIETIRNSDVLTAGAWLNLWSAMNNGRTGQSGDVWIPECLNTIGKFMLVAPEIVNISAVRQIGKTGQVAEGFSGRGIIERLSQIKSPKRNERENKKVFQNIIELLRSVTGDPEAEMDIPHDLSEILVTIHNRELPISHLGTGIHEVIILAVAATVQKDCVLCIEEPELHLHPLLQKKLIRYLERNTTNQYLFTTHSAHLLDTPDSSVFHVRMQEGRTTVDTVDTAAAKSLVCFDLGYLASDLLQANCVIWVEGPSDRIYLNHWINALDDKLVEGIHYSIMFYGGRLLSHLTANDPEVIEFISLRRLNRYIAILIDSDMFKPDCKINSTKRRVRKEFNLGPGFAWVTKGREIENYVPHPILETAIKKVHPKAKALANYGKFDRALYYKTDTGEVEKDNIDKVKIAHAVAEFPADFSVLDLNANMAKLIQFIRESNDTRLG